MKNKTYRPIFIVLFIVTVMTSCGQLNPINDFFGIQMNPDEETNFQIISYSDRDGITYKNSVTMNSKINAWAEISTNVITLKIINNSDQAIPLNYTADQFILITESDEYYLGKGGRANYFSKGEISPQSSEMFNLDIPLEYGNIARSGSGNVSARSVLRNYNKSEGNLSVPKDGIRYFIVKFGKVTVVLKKIPEK